MGEAVGLPARRSGLRKTFNCMVTVERSGGVGGKFRSTTPNFSFPINSAPPRTHAVSLNCHLPDCSKTAKPASWIRNREPPQSRRIPNCKEWLEPESNRRHEDFQSSALPTELSSHFIRKCCGKRGSTTRLQNFVPPQIGASLCPHLSDRQGNLEIARDFKIFRGRGAPRGAFEEPQCAHGPTEKPLN